jgi:hypothetical protein
MKHKKLRRQVDQPTQTLLIKGRGGGGEGKDKKNTNRRGKAKQTLQFLKKKTWVTIKMTTNVCVCP